VSSYPTLKYLTSGGKVYAYEGDRTAEELTAFVKVRGGSRAPPPFPPSPRLFYAGCMVNDHVACSHRRRARRAATRSRT
jgi:hypothetical protein